MTHAGWIARIVVLTSLVGGASCASSDEGVGSGNGSGGTSGSGGVGASGAGGTAGVGATAAGAGTGGGGAGGESGAGGSAALSGSSGESGSSGARPDAARDAADADLDAVTEASADAVDGAIDAIAETLIDASAEAPTDAPRDAADATMDLAADAGPPLADLCPGELLVFSGSPPSASVQGDLAAFGADYTAACGAAGRDAVYRLVTPQAGLITLTLAPVGFDGLIHVRVASCGTSQICRNDVGVGGTESAMMVAGAAQTLYVIVDSADSATGTFTLTVSY